MDEIITPEQWNHLKKKLKLKFPQLTDADLQYHETGEQDLLKMVEFALLKNRIRRKRVFA
jgi:hypothetical protein